MSTVAAGPSSNSVQLTTRVCIVGSGPAAHTAAIYAARALLSPIMLEGWMANGVASGGQVKNLNIESRTDARRTPC